MARGRDSAALVGRDRELELIDDLLAGLADGQSSVLLITGEPGIGKSTLAAEIRERATRHRLTVLSGAGAEYEQEMPYGPIADAIERQRDDSAARRSNLDLDAIASMLPTLAPGVAAAGVDRYALHSRVVRLVLDGAASGGLVVLIDDLHWADRASVELVSNLTRRVGGAPLMLVLLARSGQTPDAVSVAVEQLREDVAAHEVELQPLSRESAREMLGPAPGSEFDAIYRDSGGNPFFLRQLVAGGSGQATAVASVVRELSILPEGVQQVARGASLLAGTFDLGLAAIAAGVDRAQAGAAIDSLVGASLLLVCGEGAEFCFRHPIVRSAVYESTPPAWRAEAHARVACELERRGASDQVLAYHVARSAEPGDADAIALLERAADTAIGSAPATAARWFAAAARLAIGAPETSLRLMLAGSMAEGLAGRLEASQAGLLEALASLGDVDPQRVPAIRLAAVLGELLSESDAVDRMLNDELGKLQAGTLEASQLESELSINSFFRGDWDSMSAWGGRALASGGDRGVQAVLVHSSIALGSFGSGDGAAAAAAADEAAALFESLDDPEIVDLQGSAGWLGWAEVCCDRPAAAVAHCERAIEIAVATGQRHTLAGMQVVKGLAQASMGDLEPASVTAREASETASMSESPVFDAWATMLRCAVALETDPLEAVRLGERALAIAADRSPFSGAARVLLADALLRVGEPRRAGDLLASAGAAHFPLFAGRELEVETAVALASADIGRARDCADLSSRRGALLRTASSRAEAERCAAAVLLAEGEGSRALEAAAAAGDSFDQAGRPIESARAALLAGRIRMQRTDRGRATAELRGAWQRLDRLGATWLAGQAARDLKALGSPVAPSTTDALGALTPREREVAELLTTGETNRQIAARLFLSVRTVDRHVSAIFRKLGVSSRAAAVSEIERYRWRVGPARGW